MFINRPLLNGRSLHKERTTTNNQSQVEGRNKVRIKTLPTSVHYISNKHSEVNDVGVREGNLIGIKDIKEMMDGDVEGMMRKLERLEEDTQGEEKKLKKGLSKKLTRKSTMQGSITMDMKDSKEIQLEEQEDRAYRECVELLSRQRKQEEKVYEKLSQQLSRRFYQLEETRIELLELRKVAFNEMQDVKAEVSRVEQDIKIVEKRTNNRERLIEEIALEKDKIRQMNEKIIQSKQESMKQKNQFVEIQAEEIRLIKEIQAENENELKQNEKWEQFEYYKKIQKLKNKLLKQKAKQSKQIDEYFKQKIAHIVKVRVVQDDLQLRITQLSATIEQQQAVIQMLTKKSTTQQDEQVKTQTAQLKYVQDYSKIFNSKSKPKHKLTDPNSQSDNDFREIDHWQNYKFYLEKILKNQQKLESLKEPGPPEEQYEYESITNKDDQFDRDYSIQNPTKKDSHKLVKSTNFQHSGINTEKHKKKTSVPSVVASHQFTPTRTNQKSNIQSKLISNNNKFFDSPFAKVPSFSSKNFGSHQREKSRTPLPKLVKMEGNLSDKDKIKNELTKFTQKQLDQEVELETVRTSECDGQDVIEVEFKGIKPAKKK